MMKEIIIKREINKKVHNYTSYVSKMTKIENKSTENMKEIEIKIIKLEEKQQKEEVEDILDHTRRNMMTATAKDTIKVIIIAIMITDMMKDHQEEETL
jgi:hypothetical protein